MAMHSRFNALEEENLNLQNRIKSLEDELAEPQDESYLRAQLVRLMASFFYFVADDLSLQHAKSSELAETQSRFKRVTEEKERLDGQIATLDTLHDNNAAAQALITVVELKQQLVDKQDRVTQLEAELQIKKERMVHLVLQLGKRALTPLNQATILADAHAEHPAIPDVQARLEVYAAEAAVSCPNAAYIHQMFICPCSRASGVSSQQLKPVLSTPSLSPGKPMSVQLHLSGTWRRILVPTVSVPPNILKRRKDSCETPKLVWSIWVERYPKLRRRLRQFVRLLRAKLSPCAWRCSRRVSRPGSRLLDLRYVFDQQMQLHRVTWFRHWKRPNALATRHFLAFVSWNRLRIMTRGRREGGRAQS